VVTAALHEQGAKPEPSAAQLVVRGTPSLHVHAVTAPGRHEERELLSVAGAQATNIVIESARPLAAPKCR
jgi:hypothetical protein